jgi:murein L,D-transpeptidase YcbB/YkuD
MHDTTEKNYYGQPYRAVSHGCVRVQNPDQLALVLLRHDQGWTQARVASAFRGSGDNHVVLQQKIPVYISYFTLRVNDDGSISTFRDLYGHDARMAAALSRKSGTFDAPTKDNKVAASRSNLSGKRRTRPDRALTNNFARTPFGF